jgi:hypothetical protein
MLVIVVVDDGKAAGLDAGPMATRMENFLPLEVGRIEEGLERWKRRTANAE